MTEHLIQQTTLGLSCSLIICGKHRYTLYLSWVTFVSQSESVSPDNHSCFSSSLIMKLISVPARHIPSCKHCSETCLQPNNTRYILLSYVKQKESAAAASELAVGGELGSELCSSSKKPSLDSARSLLKNCQKCHIASCPAEECEAECERTGRPERSTTTAPERLTEEEGVVFTLYPLKKNHLINQ